MNRTYSTRGMHKKLLTDSMEANKSKVAKKRKVRNITVLDDEEVPEDQVVDVDDEKDHSETNSDEDMVSQSMH